MHVVRAERRKGEGKLPATREVHVIDVVRVCGAIASRQNGVVSHEQLVWAGINADMITRLIRRGFLHRLHRGVYAVGHVALPQFGREQAALLACGEDSVLSGRSALYLWGIRDAGPPDVEVTVAGRHCRKRRGIRLHLVHALDPREVRRRHGLQVTSPAWALIELAAVADLDELGDAVAQARVKRLLRAGELEAAASRGGRRAGAAAMRAFLRAETEPAITRSRVERDFRRLFRAARLPQPKVNARVAGYEVDFLWPEQRVVLEVDSYTFHGHRRAFERDRGKTMALEDAGYHVIRVTPRQLLEEPYWVIAHVARALERYGRTAA